MKSRESKLPQDQNVEESEQWIEEIEYSAPGKDPLASELRERYDQNYRKAQAEKLAQQHTQLQQRARAIAEKYSETKQKEATSNRALESSYAGRMESLQPSIDYWERQIRENTEMQRLSEAVIKSRSAFEKIRYLLGKPDPNRETLSNLQMEGATLAESLRKTHVERDALAAEAKAAKARAEQTIQKEFTEGRAYDNAKLQANRKALFKRTHSINSASKEASERTAELMHEGALDIAKLAQESNVLVVHSLPLEGWALANTSMNNTELEIEKLSPQDKINMILEKRPDLSTSIVHTDTREVEHKTMYPFGVIIGGTLIASYDDDSFTITKGDIRHRKYTGSDGTLQADPVEAFKENASRKGGGYGWNESIVHDPNIKGIFIDAERLKSVTQEDGRPYDYFQDTVTEYYVPGDEAHMLETYGDSMSSIDRFSIEHNMPMKRIIPTEGPYAGKEVYAFNKRRSGLQKALDFAKENYPDIPVYLRKEDGMYDIQGNKVDVAAIYGSVK